MQCNEMRAGMIHIHIISTYYISVHADPNILQSVFFLSLFKAEPPSRHLQEQMECCKRQGKEIIKKWGAA